VPHWFRVYVALVRATLKSRTIYRFNFLFGLLFQMVMTLSELAAVVLIVNKVGHIGGWTLSDLLLLYGLTSISSGLYRVFVAELHDFDKYLVNGEFDAVLTRPVPTFITLVTRSLDFEDIGFFIQGLAVLIVAFVRLSPTIPFTSSVFLETVGAITAGSFIWVAIVTSTAALGFWTTRIDDLQPVFLYGPETAGLYPLSIYPRAIQVVFYSLLPIAFGAYLPACAILQKGVPGVAVLGCVGAGAIAMMLALCFWRFGVSRYTSTGT
jgi:ABC-2 type transport system permease protein